MADPQLLGSVASMSKLRAILAARGLDQITPGPTDVTVTVDDPGHPEYHHRQRAEIALSRWEAATPRRYREAVATHPQVITWAQRASADPHNAGFLLLTGPVGTGKTYQAYGALRMIAEAGPSRFEMVATTAPDMYGRLRPSGVAGATETELRRLSRIPWLLVDDLGTEKVSEWTEEATYRLFNERYNECLPLIITSNLPARSDIGEDLSDRLGERIASRLSQTTTVIAIQGGDRRRVIA